jgi:hypothetical protein
MVSLPEVLLLYNVREWSEGSQLQRPPTLKNGTSPCWELILDFQCLGLVILSSELLNNDKRQTSNFACDSSEGSVV